tara:strand:- start:35535 stop:36074 length:540 start_codon:yes stop_codon:yes gene_type:complete
MSSEKYIENVTIQYLLNPNLQNQIIKNNTILSKDFNDDVKFYKKRISQYVKDICKDINSETFEISTNDKTKLACINFIKNLIEDYKFNDTKDILQEDYEEYNITNNYDISNNIDNNELDSNHDIDNILLKEKKKTISLDNFVKVKNVSKREILPNKREANLQEPHLRYKGVKKKNIDNI